MTTPEEFLAGRVLKQCPMCGQPAWSPDYAVVKVPVRTSALNIFTGDTEAVARLCTSCGFMPLFSVAWARGRVEKA